MKKKVVFFVALYLTLLLISLNSFTQSTVPIRGDTIRVYKQGGKAVLKVDSLAIITGNASIGKSLAATNYSVSLDLRDSTDAILLNRMWDTTNVLSPVNGMLIYQRSNEKFYRRENGVWVDFTAGSVLTQMSITSDGSGLKLLNDETTPTNGKFYGKIGGVKGWFAIGTSTGYGILNTGDAQSPVLSADTSSGNSLVTQFDLTQAIAGGGTVTSFSFTDANGFDGTVTNPTTTPTLSLTTTVSNTRVMYSNSGAITGSAAFTYDAGNLRLTLGSSSAENSLRLNNATNGQGYLEWYQSNQPNWIITNPFDGPTFSRLTFSGYNNSGVFQGVWFRLGSVGGQLQLAGYGDGTHTGTATKWAAFDVDGKMIEVDPPGGGGGSTALSSITAGVASNTINSGNNEQEWQWNTLAGKNAFTFSSNSTAAAGNAQVLVKIALTGTNVNAGQTTSALVLTNDHAGTGAINSALSVGASNGSTNYAIYSDPGINKFIGNVELGIAGTLGVLKFFGNTSGVITIQSQAAAGTYTLTLPANDGDADQFLKTDGSGGLSWFTPAGGGTIGGSITDNQVAVGAATANTIEGSSNFTYDGTTLLLNTNMGINTALADASLAFHAAGTGWSTALGAQVIIDATAAYSTTPSAGIVFRTKYNSAGNYTPMGGMTVHKENATDGQFGSRLIFWSRTDGSSSLATGFELNASQEILFGGAVALDQGDYLHQLIPVSTTQVGTLWRGVSSQTADFWQAKNSGGTTLSSLDKDGNLIVPTEVYGAGWDGSNEVPTKDALYDKIETLGGGGANTALSNLAAVAINTSLLPATDDAIDLGSSTKQWRDLYMTGASIYMSGVKTLSSAGLDLPTGGGIRTRTSAGNTVLLQAYDVDGAAYTTFGTLTANNTPTFNLSSSVTLGGDPILTTVAAAAAYQPLDADLSTWAGITPGSNVGTFLATPSSANLRSALTDENGTGVALFNGATTPDFTTGITIGGAAATGATLVGNGTNFVPQVTRENWTSFAVSGSDATTTGQTLVDITGLTSGTLLNSTKYEVEARLDVGTSAVTTGTQYAVFANGTGGAAVYSAIVQGTTTTNAVTQVTQSSATQQGTFLTTSGTSGVIIIRGFVTTRGSGTATISIQHLKVTSGTSTVRVGSYMKIRVAN